jgi:hypothetical protein
MLRGLIDRGRVRNADRVQMKLRHAAAITLVGWYLMMPPASSDHPTGNVNAPLTMGKTSNDLPRQSGVRACAGSAASVVECQEQAAQSEVLQAGPVRRDQRSAPQGKVNP